MKHILILLLASMISITSWAADSVNINQASAQEIAETLVGVGPSKAEEIVRYRDMHGQFQHADELVNVKGIGLSTVDKNRDRISLGEVNEQYGE